MPQIGVVNFLNAWPLWASLEGRADIGLLPDVPSALAAKLRSGEVDAALISSVEFFRLPAGYAYHPGLCIGAENEVYSIRLFVPQPGDDFTSTLTKTRVIYTDIASRSSVAQLQVMLRQLKADIPLREINDAPARIPQLRPGEALLSIGDTALRFLEKPSFDLQREYFSMFGRGFVYALWVYRKGLQDELEPLLSEAYGIYVQNNAAFRKAAVTRFGFSAEFTDDYLTRVIRHELTPERRANLEFFARLAGFLT